MPGLITISSSKSPANPSLLHRPKNVKVGKSYYYTPPTILRRYEGLDYGDTVKIEEKIAIHERGKALVKVSKLDKTFVIMFSELSTNK